jgi:hypothetical protein
MQRPFLSGSIVDVRLSLHQRAQPVVPPAEPSALLTTASQARRAPRLAPYIDAHGQLGRRPILIATKAALFMGQDTSVRKDDPAAAYRLIDCERQ